MRGSGCAAGLNEMDDKQYKVFEDAATPSMLRAMVAVRSELAGLGHAVYEPSLVDHDFERGVGFELKHPEAQDLFSVEFILTDGDERGFGRAEGRPECGLLLSVIAQDGVFLGDWCPFNYSDQVGASDPGEVVRRVGLLDPRSTAISIHQRIASWVEGQRECCGAPHL